MAIEAKVLAEEAPEQLKRYFSAVMHRREEQTQRACFFLTLAPRTPGHSDWVNILWKDHVARPLHKAIQECTGLADPVLGFLSTYIALIDRLSSAEHPLAGEIQALAAAEQIYQAVDAAREEVKMLDQQGAFAPAIESNLWLLKALFKCLPNRRGQLADKLLNELTGGKWEWSNAPALENTVDFVPAGWAAALTREKQPLLTYRIEVKRSPPDVEVKLWLSDAAPGAWKLRVWEWAKASQVAAIELKGTARNKPFQNRGKIYTKSFACKDDFSDLADRVKWKKFASSFQVLQQVQLELLMTGGILSAPSTLEMVEGTQRSVRAVASV